MHTSSKTVQEGVEGHLNLPAYRAGRAALSRQTQWQIFQVVLAISDILLTGIAFRLAYYVRFELSLPIFQLDVPVSFPRYQTYALILVPVWIFIFAANGLYDRRNLLGGTGEYARVFRATVTGMFLVVLVGFLEPTFVFARGWLLLAWMFAFLFTAGGRFWLRRVVYNLRKRGYFLTPTLVVGVSDESLSLTQQLLSWRTSGLDVLGFVDDDVKPGTPVYKHLHTLGKTDRIHELIRRYDVKEMILMTSALSRDEITAIFRKYGVVEDLNLRLSSGLFEIMTTGLEVKEMAYVPLVSVHKVRLTGLDRFLKLSLDYVIAIPGLIAIAPFLLFIAIAIKLDSPGPIIYRRRVMGLNGKKFDAYKFRTMHVNGDEILARYPELQAELAQNHKLKRDPRVTRVGQFLRKTSLDELPQLFNVIKREMSLVGPRMISPEEMKMYDEWGLNLLTVPPGITGLWQVSGRSVTSYDTRVQLDMHYIRNWTIWLDLQLLLQTIPAVLKGRGAY